MSRNVPELTARQELAVEALARGCSVRAAGEAAGVTAKTVHRWAKQPHFADAAAAAATAARSTLGVRIELLRSRGLDVLSDALASANEHVRLRAAVEVFRHDTR